MIQDLFNLGGRAVILTGASSGLGQRFATVLDEAGADLLLVARRAERIEALAKTLRNARTLPLDVTEAGAAERALSDALTHFGKVDVVVNNAGISRVLAAVDDTVDGFRQELEIDLVAPYEFARAAARWMIDAGRPGSIVNVGSVLGHGGGGQLKAPGYAAAKGGLHNLTRELASQWARKNVRVNAIGPGWFETEMNADMFSTDGGMNYITGNTPMGRAGRTGELDGALLYLASDASTYVTGHILFVDGGWTAI